MFSYTQFIYLCLMLSYLYSLEAKGAKECLCVLSYSDQSQVLSPG